MDLFSHSRITTQRVKLLLPNNVKLAGSFCILNPPSQILAIFIFVKCMLGSKPLITIPHGCPLSTILEIPALRKS